METKDLLNAIMSGDASTTQDAFAVLMAEKVASKLDDVAPEIAAELFGAQIDEINIVDKRAKRNFLKANKQKRDSYKAADTTHSYAAHKIGIEQGDNDKARAKKWLDKARGVKSEGEEVDGEQIDEASKKAPWQKEGSWSKMIKRQERKAAKELTPAAKAARDAAWERAEARERAEKKD